MGVHKDELRQVVTEVTDAWESVGYPTHLFNKLIIPFEQGAWDCPSAKSGVGYQCFLGIDYWKTQLTNAFYLAAGDAEVIYSRFPSDR